MRARSENQRERKIVSWEEREKEREQTQRVFWVSRDGGEREAGPFSIMSSLPLPPLVLGALNQKNIHPALRVMEKN